VLTVAVQAGIITAMPSITESTAMQALLELDAMGRTITRPCDGRV
jgi:hypothetical protein